MPDWVLEGLVDAPAAVEVVQNEEMPATSSLFEEDDNTLSNLVAETDPIEIVAFIEPPTFKPKSGVRKASAAPETDGSTIALALPRIVVKAHRDARPVMLEPLKLDGVLVTAKTTEVEEHSPPPFKAPGKAA